MRKQRIRLTESDLHRIIKESVRNILKEATSLRLGQRTWDDLSNAYWDADISLRRQLPKHNWFTVGFICPKYDEEALCCNYSTIWIWTNESWADENNYNMDAVENHIGEAIDMISEILQVPSDSFEFVKKSYEGMSVRCVFNIIGYVPKQVKKIQMDIANREIKRSEPDFNFDCFIASNANLNQVTDPYDNKLVRGGGASMAAQGAYGDRLQRIAQDFTQPTLASYRAARDKHDK